MTAKQLLTWIQVAPALIAALIMTEQQIVALIRSMHADELSEAELDEVCELILAGAARHKALADADQR